MDTRDDDRRPGRPLPLFAVLLENSKLRVLNFFMLQSNFVVLQKHLIEESNPFFDVNLEKLQFHFSQDFLHLTPIIYGFAYVLANIILIFYVFLMIIFFLLILLFWTAAPIGDEVL